MTRALVGPSRPSRAGTPASGEQCHRSVRKKTILTRGTPWADEGVRPSMREKTKLQIEEGLPFWSWMKRRRDEAPQRTSSAWRQP
jgi:hypothetical protein